MELQTRDTVLTNRESATEVLPCTIDIEASTYADLSIRPLRTMLYGSPLDGVIEAVCETKDGGVIEVGYYFGSLKPKGIIKVSSQIGCIAACSFCDVGDERFIRNVKAQEILDQVTLMKRILEREGLLMPSGYYKISFAGTGEPLLNESVPEALSLLGGARTSFKISTVFPSGEKVLKNLESVANIAGAYPESIQLQVSLISTDDEFRRATSGIKVASLHEVSAAGKLWRSGNPIREQINLSLILAESTPVDVGAALELFRPEHYRFRFRPCIPTEHSGRNQLETISVVRFQKIQQQFAERGYYVGDEAIPTATEQTYSLASNVSRRRVMAELKIPFAKKLIRRMSL